MNFLMAGAINGFISVALGAFAAHGLSQRLDERMLAVFKTGAEYQMYHALALILVGLLMQHWPQVLLFKISGWAFLLGILFFSFSLYALALSGIGLLGAITPIGGVCFLTGWFCLAYAAYQYAG